MSTVPASDVVLNQATQGNRRMLLLQIVKLTCKLGSVLVLARVVAPDDHGRFAMASSVLLFLSLFRDAGLGTAAIQAVELSTTQLNTLFWSHLGIGFVLTGITCALAQAAGHFYHASSVTPLLLVTSVSFLLIGGGGFARTQLERASRFADVSRIEGVSAFLGTLLMIAAAFAGAGAYSFAVYLLVSEAVATLLAWRALAWRPTAGPRWSSLRPLLHLGADVTAYQTLTYCVQMVDGIVVGRLFGAHWLGLYNRSNQLLTLPFLYVATPLNQVGLVALARLRASPTQFAKHAAMTTTVIAHLVLPLFAICIALPAETVRLVLGPQWSDAAPILRMLSIAAAATTVTAIGYSIAVAAGQTRRLVFAAAIALPITLFAVWLGSRHGALGVAQAVAVTSVALALPRLWWVLKDLPYRLAQYIDAMAGPLVTAVAVAVGACGAVQLPNIEISWMRLGIGLFGAGIAAIIVAVTWPRVRREWQIVAHHLPLPWTRRRGVEQP